MKFAVAVHGTRGDIEPCAAVAHELVRRGHEVRLAVPPNLVDFVASTGLSPVVPWGPDSESRVLSWGRESMERWLASRDEAAVEAGRELPPSSGNRRPVRSPLTMLRQFRDYLCDGWAEISETLVPLAEGVDLILTGMTYAEVAGNVAEYYDIPLAAMHWCPLRANSYLLPVRLPLPVIHPLFAVEEWGYWRLLKSAEDQQRLALGLPNATTASGRRLVESGTLEIQAYDGALFPGLNEEWHGTRPFVGRLGTDFETHNDAEILAWIGKGAAPIYFGFGSNPVDSPQELLALIESVCAELGERALVNASGWGLEALPESPALKVVDVVNYPLVFPKCRVVVHHGGSGTVAEGIKAGVPTVVLWSTFDQPLWGRQIERLKLGTSRKFSRTTRASLIASLRKVLAPEYTENVRRFASQMTKPSDGIARGADLVEGAAVASRHHDRPAG